MFEEASSLKVQNVSHWGQEWRNTQTSKLTGERSEKGMAKGKIKLESNQTSREYGGELPFVLDKQNLILLQLEALLQFTSVIQLQLEMGDAWLFLSLNTNNLQVIQ